MTVVHGGDTAAAFRVELASGRLLFAKTHQSPPAGFFSTESTGLAWLRASGAVRGRLRTGAGGVPAAERDRPGRVSGRVRPGPGTAARGAGGQA